MNFSEAFGYMLSGGEIRREFWPEDTFIWADVEHKCFLCSMNGDLKITNLVMEEIFAEDWVKHEAACKE